jgi:hypothetical protein
MKVPKYISGTVAGGECKKKADFRTTKIEQIFPEAENVCCEKLHPAFEKSTKTAQNWPIEAN